METHRLENRRSKRARMVVAVKISRPGSDANSEQIVHTLDLCTSGAKLGGLREALMVGEIVMLHRNCQRATCKIAWTRTVGPGEFQVGIQLLEADPNFWGLDLAEENISPRGKLDAHLQMLLTKR